VQAVKLVMVKGRQPSSLGAPEGASEGIITAHCEKEAIRGRCPVGDVRRHVLVGRARPHRPGRASAVAPPEAPVKA
jgi:hypothetical protein